ncbi:MAG: sodium:proton antiporter [Verrucomicrobiales bacterium]|nr:sodium:proton antiporter [Verrucomicrobiales bacterium]
MDSFVPGISLVEPHPLMTLPFLVMLIGIAVMPFVHAHWWERYLPWVAAGLGSVTVVYYVFSLHNGLRMVHAAHEYVSFMVLVGSLFIVSGGIHIEVKGEAKPWLNCLFLVVGALAANLIGTTGASMLLIRPWIRMNKYRFTGFHLIFFIFIVSNAGGALTPIGDPPLFLGYLKGVPFWWVAQNCWKPWLVMVGGLITVFYFLDRRNFLRAPASIREVETGKQYWKVEGGVNFLFLILIVAAVFIKKPNGFRECLMALAAVGSWFLTPSRVHEANLFTLRPIREVGWLFLGIFATMAPALDYLQAHAGSLGLNSDSKYYLCTGSLSAVLDNAPTYLAFLATAMGNAHLNLENPQDIQAFSVSHVGELMAISLGSVFFGAFTYIGNGPNLLIKAMVEEMKIKTPSFFSYVIRYSFPVLFPLIILICWMFFSQ